MKKKFNNSDALWSNWFSADNKNVVAILIVLILCAIGLYLRFTGLNFSLWHDEVYTMYKYVNKGISGVLWDNYTPNNHILYSLVILGLTSVFGFSEFIVRLPALLAGFLAILCIFVIIKNNIGIFASIVFLAFSLFNVEQVDLSTQARGYGFAFFFSALLLYYSYRIVLNQGKYNYAALAVVTVLGVYSYPLFIVLSVATYLQLLFMTGRWKFLFISGLAAAVAMVILHLPVLGDFFNYYLDGAQSYGTPLPWHAFITLPVEGMRDVYGGGINQLPFILQGFIVEYLIIFAFVIVGLALMWKNNKNLVMLIIIPPTVLYIISSLLSIPMVPRFISFISLHYIALLSVGMADSINHLLTYRLKYLNSIASIITALTISLLIAGFTLTAFVRTQEVKAMPRENFKEAFQVAKRADYQDFVIVTNSKRAVNFQFYAEEMLGVDQVNVFKDNDDLLLTEIKRLNSISNVILFDHVFLREPIEGLAELLEGNSKPHQVSQRRRGYIKIYLIDQNSLK